jgi:predicted kinase
VTCERASTEAPPAALIVVGGFAGTGKSTISRRLSGEFRMPRLGSDTLGRSLKNSLGSQRDEVDAYRLAYDLLFRLGEEFIQSGVSVVLDLTMGWKFQWQHVDGIIQRYPQALFLPVILRCPYETCIARIRQRHAANPDYYDPPELYQTEPKILGVWEYLDCLNRPDVHFVDAAGPHDEVYEAVRGYVSACCVPLKVERNDVDEPG